MKKKEGIAGNPEQSGPKPQKSVAPRRGALKRLAAGGAAAGIVAGLPSRWTRPVIESVMLPAHAQTSGPGEPGEPDGVFFASALPTDSGSILDWFVPAAHAIVAPDCEIESGCATLSDGKLTLFLGLSGGKDSACFGGVGVVGDTVALSPQNGIVQLICNKTVDIVSLEGTAPNRTLTLSNGNGERSFQETTGDCDCDSVTL